MKPKLTVPAAAVLLAMMSLAQANPSGSSVVSGTATVSTSGSTLTVTNSPNAIINWQAFSIGASETTRFVQQSASSAVLNRVVSSNPSSILGTLASNGSVFLVNPSGILFGAGAQVNVGGLVASTLDISNADFISGHLQFVPDGAAGPVTNNGTLLANGGSVALVGGTVTSSGAITADRIDVRGSSIVIAAGAVLASTAGTTSLLSSSSLTVESGATINSSGTLTVNFGLPLSSPLPSQLPAFTGTFSLNGPAAGNTVSVVSGGFFFGSSAGHSFALASQEKKPTSGMVVLTTPTAQVSPSAGNISAGRTTVQAVSVAGSVANPAAASIRTAYQPGAAASSSARAALAPAGTPAAVAFSLEKREAAF